MVKQFVKMRVMVTFHALTNLFKIEIHTYRHIQVNFKMHQVPGILVCNPVALWKGI